MRSSHRSVPVAPDGKRLQIAGSAEQPPCGMRTLVRMLRLVDGHATALVELRRQLASSLVSADQLDRSVIPVDFGERQQFLERGSVVQVLGQTGAGRISLLWTLARAITAQQEWVAIVDTDCLGTPHAGDLHARTPETGARRTGTPQMDGYRPRFGFSGLGSSAGGGRSARARAGAGQNRAHTVDAMPHWGWVAAAEAGVELDRVALVRHVTSLSWPAVVDTICSGITMVIAPVPTDVSPSVIRRVESRVREHKSILVVDEGWTGRVGLTLTASQSMWEGLGPGTGLLRERALSVEVTARNRRSENFILAHAS